MMVKNPLPFAIKLVKSFKLHQSLLFQQQINQQYLHSKQMEILLYVSPLSHKKYLLPTFKSKKGSEESHNKKYNKPYLTFLSFLVSNTSQINTFQQQQQQQTAVTSLATQQVNIRRKLSFLL